MKVHSVDIGTRKLTPRQREILGFIISYHSENGKVPGYGVLKEKFNFSKSAAQQFINGLCKIGYLEKVSREIQPSYKIVFN